MTPLSIARLSLLLLATLAILSATVLDGIMMRHVVHPFLRLGARATGEAVRPPRLMAFMLERAWARRIYHVMFAAVLLAVWWYLGTDAGAAHWAAMTNPPAS